MCVQHVYRYIHLYGHVQRHVYSNCVQASTTHWSKAVAAKVRTGPYRYILYLQNSKLEAESNIVSLLLKSIAGMCIDMYMDMCIQICKTCV